MYDDDYVEDYPPVSIDDSDFPAAAPAAAEDQEKAQAPKKKPAPATPATQNNETVQKKKNLKVNIQDFDDFLAELTRTQATIESVVESFKKIEKSTAVVDKLKAISELDLNDFNAKLKDVIESTNLSSLVQESVKEELKKNLSSINEKIDESIRNLNSKFDDLQLPTKKVSDLLQTTIYELESMPNDKNFRSWTRNFKIKIWFFLTFFTLVLSSLGGAYVGYKYSGTLEKVYTQQTKTTAAKQQTKTIKTRYVNPQNQIYNVNQKSFMSSSTRTIIPAGSQIVNNKGVDVVTWIQNNNKLAIELNKTHILQ